MKTSRNQIVKPQLCILLGFVFLFASFSAIGQNVGSIGKDQAVKVSGTIGAKTGFYTSKGREARRDPYFYLLNANINFNIYGVNIPFSAIFSQQETNFLQPFNQFGLSPYYKSLKIHLGFRSMNFSSFTLNGHTFLGVGFDFTPKINDHFRLRTGAMYGRLRRAVATQDSLTTNTLSFKRMGYSGKVGVGYGDDSFIDFILFKAKDDINSITIDADAFSNVLPAENLVLGINAKHQIGKRINVLFDYSNSAYTRDIRSEEEVVSTHKFYNNLGNVFTTRNSTQFNAAFKTGISYDADKFGVSLNYKRIDSDFRTLGAYFFLNDIEDYTAAVNTKLFSNKMQITATGGWQRNNLNEEKSARATRFIASIAMAFSEGTRWNFNINASNYSSFLTVIQDQFSDSSNVYQVSRNLNFSTDYLLVEKGNQQSIWGNIGIQNGSFRDEYQLESTESQFMTLNVGHRFNWRNQGMNINSSMTYTSNTATGYAGRQWGPNLTISQRLGKTTGTRVNYSTAYLLGYLDSQYAYNHFTNRITVMTRFQKKHTLTLGIAFFFKNDKINTQLSYSEIKGNLGYRYSF